MAKKRKQKNRQVGNKEMKKGFHDLLLPILFSVVILPFITYLKVYSTGLGNYDFYPQMDLSYDFYTYYRSRCFVWVMGVALVVLIGYLVLYQTEAKPLKLFWPLGVFGLLCFCSAAFSKEPRFAWFGGVNSNQSVWIIMGYLILLVYTYEFLRDQDDYRQLLFSFMILAFLMGILGVLQMLGMDPLNYEIIQKACMNSEDETLYIGNVGNTFSSSYVFFALFNPNYASVFLSMAIVFLVSYMISGNGENQKKTGMYICYFLLVLFIILQYFTYSRMGYGAIVAGVFFVFFFQKVTRKTWMLSIGFAVIALLVIVGIDATRGFKLFHRLGDEKVEETLSDIMTAKDGVHLYYKGEEEIITFDSVKDNPIICQGDGRASVVDQYLEVRLCDQVWKFGFEDEIYYYLNPFGKHQILKKTDRVNLHGFESLASGRGYFWSRLLPKLPGALLLGYGADTMITVFPQDDYAGRLLYSKDLTMICDRAHSGYLQVAIEQGILAFLVLLLFLGYACKEIVSYYKKRQTQQDKQLLLSQRMGMAGLGAFVTFLVGMLTNDCTIFLMPFACVLLGMSLASVHIKKDK